MTSVLLGRVLVLLWVSTAWAEVLVQPEFDVKKVVEASVRCCGGWGWASAESHGDRVTGGAVSTCWARASCCL